MTSEVLTVEDRGPLRVITLNRPERGNSLDARLGKALLETARETAHNPSVRAVLLTGAGRSFCSGDDIAGVLALTGAGDLSAAAADESGQFYYPLICSALLAAPQPVVAAINGTVAGAGLEIACAADLRLCSDTARFGVKVLSIGHAGCAALLPRVIGWPRATELFLTSRWMDAAETHRIGLVSSVHAETELVPHALALAEDLARSATGAIGYYKSFRAQTEHQSADQAVLAQQQLHETVLANVDDASEGPRAHIERRQPRFTGR